MASFCTAAEQRQSSEEMSAVVEAAQLEARMKPVVASWKEERQKARFRWVYPSSVESRSSEHQAPHHIRKEVVELVEDTCQERSPKVQGEQSPFQEFGRD